MIAAKRMRLACIASFALACTVLLTGPAVAQVNPYNSIGLEWTATGDDSTAGRASSYDLRYASSDPSQATSLDTWFQAATRATGLPTPSISGATDSTRVTGLTPGTTYWFLLKVYDDAGNASPYSNIANGTTIACTVPSMTPGSLSASATAGGVQLAWAPAPDSATKSLHLYRRGGSGTESLVATLAPSATGYTDGSVSPGAVYSYRAAYASACADGPSTGWTAVATSTVSAEGASMHAFPNPASRNGAVNLAFHVPGTIGGAVLLNLFDINGRLMAKLVDGTYPPGDHTETWDGTGRTGSRVAPGLYEIVGTIGTSRVQSHLVLRP